MSLKLKMFSLFCLLSTFVFAQDLENSLLWEVINKDNNQTSYLYATMNIGCNSKLNEEIEGFFEQIDLLLLETAPTSQNHARDKKSQMFMNNKKTLLDLMSEEEYYLLANYVNPRLASQGVNLELVNNVQPAIIATMLTENLVECTSSISHELQLTTIAQGMDVEVLGIESFKEQMKLFSEVPEAKIVKALLDAAEDDGAKNRHILTEMMEAYQIKDLNRLKLLANENQEAFFEFNDQLIIQKNEKWVPQFIKYLTEYRVMIAVNALQFAGEKGIINLLREEGFEVNPVK